jgi:NAD(P)-dependent dehydrogenase (short-subunit alcohol dehydrogenase family)
VGIEEEGRNEMRTPDRHDDGPPEPELWLTRRGLLKRQAAAGAGLLAAGIVPDGALAADAGAASASVAVHPRLYPLSSFVPEVDLRGKVAVITGASTGIGRAAGEALAARGAHVIGTSRDVAGVRQHPRFSLLDLDVTQAKSINSFVQKVRRRIGSGGRVDILINNAGRGIIGDPIPPIGGANRYFEQLEVGIKTNYAGQLMVTNKMLPLLPTRGYARVYFTVSIGAYSVATNALNLLHAYISVKRALLAFANAWSWTLQQARRNVAVATVNPYTTNTRWGYNIILLEKAPRGSTLAAYAHAVRESLAHAQPASIVGEAYWQLLSTNQPPLNIAAGSAAEPYGAANQLYSLDLIVENSQAAIQFGC